jgi:hypothetical protein
MSCRKIFRHGTSSFTSHPKEGVLRIFIALKNPSFWPVSNPQHLGLVASTLTTTPPRRLAEAWPKLSVDAWRRRQAFLSLAVQCCHVLPFRQGKWVVRKPLWDNRGNTCEFGSVPRDTIGAEKQTNTVDPRHTLYPIAYRSPDWFSRKLHERRNILNHIFLLRCLWNSSQCQKIFIFMAFSYFGSSRRRFLNR